MLALLDTAKLPKGFVGNPPKFMRVTAYKYHFTGYTNAASTASSKKALSIGKSKDWWYRDEQSEYLHIVSMDSLEEYLTQMGVLDKAKSHQQQKRENKSISPNFGSKVLVTLRAFHLNFKPHFIVQQVFLGMVFTQFFLAF